MDSGHARLARYVRRDRLARWRSRAEFARAAGVGKRTVDRMETGTGRDYLDTVKARVEAALGWTDGSVNRVLAGGRPGYVRDRELAELLALWPSLHRDTRVLLARLAREVIERRTP